MEYDLLFKWFLDLNIMDHSFDHSVFAKNRQRLLDADVAREFLLQIVEQARERRLLSEDHFSVDGTLLEAWASLKSFRPRDEDPPLGGGSEGGGRNREVDFRGERRRNETHRSTTDPEARLARKGKGKEARLCFGAHVLMDNREGLVVDVRLTPADGAGRRHQGFHQGMPEPECNAPCGPEAALGHRQTHHSPRWLQGQGYRVSQRARKRVEEVFGWINTVAVGRKLRCCGIARNRLWAEMTIAGYNLVRLAKLAAAVA